MSYALNGVNFEDQQFTPSSDAAIWRHCISDGRLEGLALTASGSGVNITAGWLMAGGKELQLPAAITAACDQAVSGYARLRVKIDLSQTATESVFSQAAIYVDYANSIGAFASLTQQDLAAGGTVYEMVLCVVSLGAAGVTGIVATCGDAHAKAAGITVDLPANGWLNKAQTVRVDGVHSDTNVVVSWADGYKAAYVGADIDCSGQAEGALTFSCAAVPDDLVQVNVLLL